MSGAGGKWKEKDLRKRKKLNNIMKDSISVSLVQFDSVWEDKFKNIQKAENILSSLYKETDIVIFPEMFLTGFSMNTDKTSETMDGEMVHWMKSASLKYNFVIMGSLPIMENEKYYNRLIIYFPDNKHYKYDKRHLFRMGEEMSHFNEGNDRIIIPYNGWKIMPLVCYDLRFPVWSRNVNLEYDLLIYVANWPSARNDAFLTLLKARAIENSSYVIGVNRVGNDGNNLNYIGNSVIFDPKGKALAGLIENNETVINFKISLPELNKYREKFPSHLDGDNFTIQI